MKKIFAAITAAVLVLAVAGCGKQNGESSDKTDGRIITIDGFAENMYPNLDRMDSKGNGNFAGTVDVDMVFGKTLKGWKAVEAAYEKMQPGVNVRLNEYSDGTYLNSVTNAANNSSTDWDIFQGNRISNISSVAINLTSQLYGENHYAGKETDDSDAEEGSSKLWQNVLSTDAYITDKSGSNTSCYIMNSESLSTAWFVNSTAFKAAAALGYKNSDGKAETPVTWDDLISLCSFMVKAGYSHPLGLSGDNSSVNESQLAWIFRIYGDQYYRDLYPEINVQEGDALWTSSSIPFNFSLTDPQPESSRGYNPSLTRFWNTVLDENNQYNTSVNNLSYSGAMSDKFACLLQNIYKMRDYLPIDFTTAKFDEVCDAFMSFRNNDAPVILLDYTGFGLTFGTEDRGFDIDFFDYPPMTCSHDEKHVTTDFVRDVGGNGGYISVMNHKGNTEQNNMNIDFVKFFMSPYGQSLYYRALNENKIAPDGLSTVLDIAIPETWKAFFNSDKIKFNGLCDVDWYDNNFIYHVNGQTDSRAAHLNVVQKFLKTGNFESADAAVHDFQTSWDAAVRTGYNTLCENMGWSKDLWKYPGSSPIV